VTITLDRSKTVPVPVDAVAADAGIRPLQGPLPGEDVLDLFDRVCRAHARDVAVEWRGRAVSYRELDRLSRRLACRLRAEGLGEGDVAVLWLEDRVLWIAALLACLRSGCAFAPIDPDWPEGRRQAVLADLEPRVALVDGSAPELPGVTRLRLDEAGDGPLWAGPRAQVDADALCYVYSTSGSTGRPKGIAGRRKGLSHFIRWEIETLDLPAGPRVTQLTSPAFDASLRDVLVPLCAGGRVCIPPAPPAALDPALLVGWLAESGAQVLHCVPSLFRALAQAPAEAGSLAELRFVLLAGEELRVPDVQAWRQRFGRAATVVNLYGSTETTMVKLFHVVRDEDLERGFIPIGRPMKGARALLLQEDLTVTRQGSVGEIFIRSPYMTLGYYRQPEKTREVFLPNPFSQDPQDLVFRTGDLARMLEDGSFQFIGRKGGLVKVRGLRIEPGEIETCLLGHEEVREAVVVPREDRPGDVRLVAYLVGPDRSTALSAAELRAFLRRTLPEAMIPSSFVRLEKLPFLPNGKLDRQALPAPARDEVSAAWAGADAQGPVEEMLAGLWAEMLGVERVGPRESFFDLGGHSLLATQLIARARDLFGIEVPLRRLLEEPTVAGMAAALQDEGAAGAAVAPRIVRAPRRPPIPLSFAQQRLWFLEQLLPGRSDYHVSAALRAAGGLDRPRLAASLHRVAGRHEALRTSFPADGGEPRQEIAAAPAPLTVLEIDLRAVPQDRREEEARRLAAVLHATPFDLENGPLLRVTALRLAAEESLLVLVMHHLVSDAWSIWRLVGEVAEVYRALGEGVPAELPELPLQYADYAIAQREWMDAETLERLLGYWLERLQGAPEVLELPTDRPRPAARSFRGATRILELPAAQAAALSDLARRHRVTPFVTLLAGFAAVLGRWTGTDDVSVGVPIAGRRQTALEPLIGFFVNTLVLRCDLGGDPDVAMLLGRLRETVLGAWGHQDLPFERLVEELRPQRDLAHTPLFQVMLAFQNTPRTPLALPGLRLAPVDFERGRAHFDLTLRMSEEDGGLRALLEHSLELFDGATVERLAGHLAALLAGATAAPESRLSDLPLLAEAEAQQLRHEWNDTAVERRTPPLWEMFRARAERDPAAVALVAGEEEWTYGELLERAGRLAHWLRGRGCGPDVVVAVLLERSPELVAALLGVLAAGGAFLPLDPAAPAARLRALVAGAEAPLLISRRALVDGLGETGAAPVLVDADPAAACGSAGAPEVPVEPASLAYVMFTSGSTGAPKGVMVSQGALSSYLVWAGAAYRVEEGAGAPVHSSIAFDLTLTSLFLPLLAGRRVVLLPESAGVDALGRELAAGHGFSLVKITPAHLEILAASLPAERAAAAARTLVVGGEALSGERLALWREHAPRVRVVNEYGPTETVVGCAVHALAAGDAVPGPVAIGRPIAETVLDVLDRDLRPVPVGVPGELLIGGAGVARGYFGRPDLTAERFVPDGSGRAPGARLYRTGDRVRRRPDGALEYLGRTDHQVKLRGYRIEPGEIERTLALHPAVRKTVVVLREDRPGDLRLAAYWAPATPGGTTAAELSAFLAERLPAYMVPPDIVRLDELRLTSNGKVDRRALPAPRSGDGGAAAGAPPREGVEEILAGLWSDVLGRPCRDVDADFFAQGGHSLLATRLLARMRGAFGVDLPLRALFDHPTIAGQSAEIERRLREEQGMALPPLEPLEKAPRDGELPLSFGQLRLWFLHQLEPASPAYNIRGGLRLFGRLEVEALRRSLEEAVRRHEILRTTFPSVAGGAVQRIAPSPRWSLPVADLSALPAATAEGEAKRLAAVEGRRPFDLQDGPLMRSLLVRCAREEHLLLLNLHHIVSDGWSMTVLVDEVTALYDAFAASRPSPLAERALQYADYAVWQRRWLDGEPLEREMDWWRRQLAGAPSGLDLPTDRPRPAVRSGLGASLPLALPADLSVGLRALARSHGTTLFMTLLAGLDALLARVSGQEDVVVGTPIANRGRLETEGMIGFFVNTLALRVQASGDAAFTDLLARVRETTLGAYAHQDLPFERLVDEMQPERDLSRTPLFQVVFSLQAAAPAVREVAGLRLAPEEVHGTTSKFDLALVLADEGEAFAGLAEHATDLFDRASVERLLRHYTILLRGAVAEPGRELRDLPLLAPEERRQLLHGWNLTQRSYDRDGRMHRLVEESVDRAPDAVAVVWEGESWTYRQLDARANRIAHLLRDLGLQPGDVAGFWLERSPDLLAAMLGILKAGGTYLPLDLAWPLERVETILASTGARCVITRGERLGALQPLQWRLPRLTDLVCLDVEAPTPPAEPLDADAVRGLWDYVAEKAVDRITEGGFVSAYTGEAFSEAEVDVYRDRVAGLARTRLAPGARVLEIGCGSGLILFELAPQAARYVGIDPSERTQARNRERVAARGLSQVELLTGFAHDVAALPEESFDLVILASVVQFFPGLRYLEQVLEIALRRLAPGGTLLLADVVDPRREAEFSASLAGRAPQATKRAGHELAVDEGFLRDLWGGLGAVAVLHRGPEFTNELRFRYDALLARQAEGDLAPRERRSRRVWTGLDVSRAPEHRPADHAAADDAAYIIHTSGSTGLPKGIVVQHRPVVNLIEWVNRELAVGPEDRVLFVTSPCFDLSVWDVFGLLAAGGSVHVAAEEDLRDPERLVRRLTDELVTIWDSAPAALQQLAPLFPAAAERAARLRLVMLSGDWIPLWMPAALWSAFPGVRVVGLGGATEATVWSNVHPVEAIDPAWVSIPYGRPIQNARYYVLDSRLEPCPVNVAGDLYIGGECLAMGYVSPLLTAERFLPDPAAGAPGARMYHTGDRARFRADGTIEFLGRADQQVKIRGFRIELGEIEAALARHPGVREAAVLAREDMPGDKRLVAYVVPAEGTEPTGRDLRGHLQDLLPQYMVPAAWVFLEALPVSANGKLDRRALPAPDAGRRGGDYVAPRTEAERILARIWSEVLRVEPIGIEDNFFELGGDSILSIQIVSRAHQAGLRLAPRQLFDHQTVAELAAVALAVAVAEEETGPSSGPAPLTPAQLWFFERETVDAHWWNQSLLLEVGPPSAVPAALAGAVAALVAHHEALRLRFGRDEAGLPVARIAAPVDAGTPFVRVDLGTLPAARQEEAASALLPQLQASLDPVAGPVLRVALLDRGAARPGLLHLAIHHLAVDGVSWRILLEDLETAYRRIAGGGAPKLPAKTTSLPRWGALLAEHARSAALEELGFWEDAAAEAPVLRLPVDLPGGVATVGSEAAVSLSFDEEETRALLQRVPSVYRTQINDVLLAALAGALARRLGRGVVPLDLEGHGREEICDGVDLSRTVGWMTAIFPFPLRLDPEQGPATALKATKEQGRAVPGRGLGYGVLRYLGTPQTRERLRSMPAAEISFNYLGQLDQALPVDGWLRPAGLPAGPGRSPRQLRRWLLEVQASVTGGRLRLTWTYSASLHRRATVESLASGMAAELRALIAHCLAPEAGGFTPSDFPLARLGQERIDHLATADPLLEDLYPLSPAQQGILFHTLNDPVAGLYCHQLDCELAGPLDPAAFGRAWEEVMGRHAILRTAFLWEGLPAPLQKVSRRAAVPLVQEDWSLLPEAERRDRWADHLSEDRLRPFDVARAPLMRLRLVRWSERSHRLGWTHHQILLDGWSIPRLLQEVFAAYAALRDGDAPRLAPARPYRDFIAWLVRRDRGAAEAFWRAELRGFHRPTAVELGGGPRPEGAGFGEERLALTEAASETLRRLARSRQLTLNTLVQGAWALLLARASGERDVVFGAVTSGRPADLRGAEEMLGVFLNTLPLRARLDETTPAAEWLRALQAGQLAAREHEHTPLVDVQGWSEIPRGQALFQSILAFENYPVDEALRRPDRELEVRDARFGEVTHYPLTVLAVPRERLELRLLYDAGRFGAVEAVRLLDLLGRLLAGLAEAPERPAVDLPALAPAEEQQILREWNDTRELPVDGLLHGMFRAQARRTPEAVAAVHGTDRLTYRELEERMDRLARRLRAAGVGPDVLVGLCAERSLDLVVGVLGILAAGGAYVPLDPAYPAERLAVMLEDSGAPVVLAQERALGRLPASAARVLRIDAPEGAREAAAPVVREPLPASLAYVIYTSGSTGRPKGVAITHASAAALLLWSGEVFSDGDVACVLASTSLSFDLSVFELLVPLTRGGRVVVAANALALPDLPSAGEITLVNTVPSALTELLRDGELPESVRVVNLAGEPLPEVLAERLHAGSAARGLPRRLYDLYGPSEDTTYSTFAAVEPGSGAPSIGRPIAGTRAFLLGPDLRPVPPGAAGELCLAGQGLARGYFGRPELTAERFLPDAWSGRPGERLYRTGDLARFLPDGRLDFLGRIDQQVKIRGFRIELGEIETALARCSGVREAAAVAREDVPGRKRLVACVVPEAGRALDPAALRERLLERLPEHMVPSAFVELAALPLTPNGKVDRRALAGPGFAPEARAGADRSSGPLRSEAERRLAAVWEEVLRVRDVGPADNFFALGGDSIVSLQIVSHARQAGLRITPRQVFEHPVLADLAAVAGRAERAAADQSPVTGPVPLTPIQHWFFEADLLEPHHWNQTFLFAVRSRPDARALGAALQALVCHHDALRHRFARSPQDARAWRQTGTGPAPVPLAAIDLSTLPDPSHAVEAAASALQASLDLAAGPLLRAAWLDLGTRGTRLLLVIHHLVVDGVSWRVLLQDLETAYGQAVRGQRIELPAKTTSFRRWAETLARHAGELGDEIVWWREVAAAPARALPVDLPGENTVARMAGVTASLSAEDTRILVHEAPRTLRAQVQDLLLTALARTVLEWAGGGALRLETEGHGREDLFPDLDLSRTVGWFTSICPVVLEVGDGAAPGEALKAVKERLRSIPGHGVGYGLLRYLHPDPEVRASLRPRRPAEILFNYLGQLDAGRAADAWLSPAAEPVGRSRGPRQPRRHLLEINAAVIDGQLQVGWAYGEACHRRDTIEKLAARFLASLRELIGISDAAAFTPSDFPDMGFDQGELDDLLAELNVAVMDE